MIQQGLFVDLKAKSIASLGSMNELKQCYIIVQNLTMATGQLVASRREKEGCEAGCSHGRVDRGMRFCKLQEDVEMGWRKTT